MCYHIPLHERIPFEEAIQICTDLQSKTGFSILQKSIGSVIRLDVFSRPVFLPRPNSVSQSRALVDLAKSYIPGFSSAIWLGYFSSDANSPYLDYITGAEMPPIWAVGQPDRLHELCVMLRSYSSGPSTHDVGCGANFHVLCETNLY